MAALERALELEIDAGAALEDDGPSRDASVADSKEDEYERARLLETADLCRMRLAEHDQRVLERAASFDDCECPLSTVLRGVLFKHVALQRAAAAVGGPNDAADAYDSDDLDDDDDGVAALVAASVHDVRFEFGGFYRRARGGAREARWVDLARSALSILSITGRLHTRRLVHCSQ